MKKRVKKTFDAAGLWARGVADEMMRTIKPRPLAISIANPPTNDPSHQWTHVYVTKLDITLSDGATLGAFVVVNVAPDEASGIVTLDAKYGGSVALRRISGESTSTLKHVTASLIDQVADHLSR